MATWALCAPPRRRLAGVRVGLLGGQPDASPQDRFPILDLIDGRAAGRDGPSTSAFVAESSGVRLSYVRDGDFTTAFSRLR